MANKDYSIANLELEELDNVDEFLAKVLPAYHEAQENLIFD